MDHLRTFQSTVNFSRFFLYKGNSELACNTFLCLQMRLKFENMD